MQLIPVTPASHFPEDEDAFPYMFGAAYLRYQTNRARDRAYWALSPEGAILPLIVCETRVLRCFSLRSGRLVNPPLRHGSPLSAEDEERFLIDMIDLLRTTGVCDRLTQPPTNCVFQSVPPGAVTAPFGTYRVDLSGRTEEEIFATFHPDYRNKIRAAIKHQAEVRFGREQLPIFHALHQTTMKESGMQAVPLAEVTETYDLLDRQQRVLCGVVYHNDIPLGGVLVPLTTHSGHYWLGGSGSDVFPPGAVRLLHWEVMRELKRRGVACYDFVGARLSSVEGTKLEFIQRFKSRFGSELVRGLLWKIDVNPARCRRYDMVVSLRRKLWGGSPPGAGDIIDRERQKAEAPVLDIEQAAEAPSEATP